MLLVFTFCQDDKVNSLKISSSFVVSLEINPFMFYHRMQQNISWVVAASSFKARQCFWVALNGGLLLFGSAI